MADASGKLTITSDQWGAWVTVCMPVTNAAGVPVGAIGIDFEASYVRQVRQAISQQVTLAFFIAYTVLFSVVYFATQTVARPVEAPVEALSQVARRVSTGDYTQRFMRSIASRYIDEFDVLARTFNDMIVQVDQREQSLRREVAELRIEINDVKRQKNVEEVVNTEFFRELQAKAQHLRQHSESSES